MQAQATPGATLLTLNPTLSAATDTSIALVGAAGSMNGVVLLDDNQPPATGSAGVRFVNTSASIAAVDVFVNFSKQVTGLAINTASSYRQPHGIRADRNARTNSTSMSPAP